MEKSKVIELSRWTADNTTSNAEWTNHLSTPVVINNGDIVSVRNSYIDTRLIDANSISINEDTTLTFNFCYYLINNGVSMNYVYTNIIDVITFPSVYPTYTTPNSKTPQFNINGPDGLPYVLVNADLKSPLYGKPVIETVNINIPKGIYERSSLAEIITKQLESIGKPTNELMSNPSQLFTNGDVYAESSEDGTFFQFSLPGLAPDPLKVISTVQKQLYYGIIQNEDTNLGNIRFKHGCFYLNSQNQMVPCLFVPMTDNGNYAPIPTSPVSGDANGIIAPFLSKDKLDKDKVNSNIYINYTEVPANPNANPPTPAVTYQYLCYDAGFVGCNQFSFQYNVDNNGKFSIEYMHTPISQSNNEVCMVYTKQIGHPANLTSPGALFSKSVSYHTAMGGIMLVNAYTKHDPFKITEVQLLNQMGFKLDDLIDMEDLYTVFNGNNNWLSGSYNKFKYSNFKKYTTRNFAPFPLLYQPSNSVSLPDIKNNTDISVDINPSILYTNYSALSADTFYDGSGFNIVESSITEGIVSSSFAVSSIQNTGHFLLDLSSYPSDYINSQKTYNIKSIIGNYYLSENSFCENAYEPLLYQHIGEPIVLTKIDVKIISPYDKKPVTNLGSNSSVYLQITNQIQPLQSDQAPAKK